MTSRLFSHTRVRVCVWFLTNEGFDFKGSGWDNTKLHVLFIHCLFQVEQSKVLIKEGGVQLLLTIVDTPGFGDAVDNSNW